MKEGGTRLPVCAQFSGMIGTLICEFSSPKTIDDLKVNVTLAFHHYFRDASGKYFLLNIEGELWVAPDFFCSKVTRVS